MLCGAQRSLTAGLPSHVVPCSLMLPGPPDLPAHFLSLPLPEVRRAEFCLQAGRPDYDSTFAAS